jgi:cystathionine beta-synthase
MESLNPGYSVKDRIGISMIDWAEKEGVLKKGGTVIEATSGNTGIGLALTAAVRGYKCIFILTDKVSVEKMRYLKSLGADIVVCPAAAKHGTPDHYVETAKRISQETPGSFYPDQYNHPANPLAHYRTTGPEIWEDTDGKITHFVSGIGTGGTITGTGTISQGKKSEDPDHRRRSVRLDIQKLQRYGTRSGSDAVSRRRHRTIAARRQCRHEDHRRGHQRYRS